MLCDVLSNYTVQHSGLHGACLTGLTTSCCVYLNFQPTIRHFASLNHSFAPVCVLNNCFWTALLKVLYYFPRVHHSFSNQQSAISNVASFSFVHLLLGKLRVVLRNLTTLEIIRSLYRDVKLKGYLTFNSLYFLCVYAQPYTWSHCCDCLIGSRPFCTENISHCPLHLIYRSMMNKRAKFLLNHFFAKSAFHFSNLTKQ